MMDIIKRAAGSSFFTLIFVLFLGFSTSVSGQIPLGYYNDAGGKDGEELRTALSQIIDNHNVKQYSDLWTYFYQTDRDFTGHIIDIYTDVPGGTPTYQFLYNTDKCGQYSAEGDCYNREHTVPQSWFNGASPMYSDLFHIYPTDGYVNGKRASLPYGEVGSASYTSSNGSKVGSMSYPGYSGTVFEPIDEYKGDLARVYFYMVTRYKDKISTWNSPMFNGDTFSDWALDMLLSWHDADTVSQKEIDRNNKVHDVQNNRNPFVDSVNYVDYIWRGVTAPPAVNVGIKDAYGINRSNVSITMDDHNLVQISFQKIPASARTVYVYSMIGKEVYSTPVYGSKQITFQLNKPAGAYIVRVGPNVRKVLVR